MPKSGRWVTDTAYGSIAPGATVTVNFTATIATNAPVAEALLNTATVNYDSAPGDPLDEDGNPVGRDYSDTDDHSVANSPGLTKTAFTSNLTETDSELGDIPFELAVGETVTYRYALTLPEIDLTNVTMTDQLPAELEFLTGRIVNANGTGAGTGPAPGFSTSESLVTANLFTFNFGAMNNLSNGSIGTDDVLIFEVDAIVRTAIAGDTLTNTATLVVDPVGDAAYAPIVDTADVRVVEPALTIDKTGPLALSPGGAPGTFTIVVTNTGVTGAQGPAYDLDISDVMPTGLDLITSSLSYTIAGATVTPETQTATSTGFTSEFTLLDVGQSLIVTYQASLGADQPALSEYDNTASADFFSTPDDLLDAVGGSPVAKDYAPVTDQHKTWSSPTLDKKTIGSGFAETPEDVDADGVQDLVIGETVTYQLTLTLPEIAMDIVSLQDTLPTGMSFVSAEVTALGSEITIGGSSNLATINAAATPVTAGQLMTINLRDVLNADVGGITAADTITVQVVARVDNIASNVDDTQLTNTAGLIVTPQGGSPLDTVIDTATVEIIEPKISLEKTTSDIAPMLGDTFSYTLTVTNDPTASSPAFNTVLSDVLPFEMTLTGNFTLSNATLGTVSPTSIAGSDQLLVTIPVLQPGQSFSIIVEVELGFLTNVLEGIDNTASITSGSSPIVNDPNGRDYSDLGTARIVAQPVPTGDDEPETKAIDGIDDALFLPVILIDPIFTGTAEPGANVTINLYRQDGSLDYVRNIVSDSGGHWIAIFPRVELPEVFDDFHTAFGGSVLFTPSIQFLDSKQSDSLDYRQALRTFATGSQMQDEAYTLGVSADRPSTMQQDAGMFNTRTFFAPAHIGEIFGTKDVLKVSAIFQNIAFETVEKMYLSSADPLGASLNRFNYEFLSAQTAVPGSQ